MKKLIAIISLIMVLLVTPGKAFAEDNCVQVQVYGGGVGVVCGAKTHEPVDTALIDFNPVLATTSIFSLSGVLYLISRKINKGR